MNCLTPETFIFLSSIQYFPKYVLDIVDQPEKISSFFEEVIYEMGKKTLLKKGGEKDKIQLEELEEFMVENYFKCKLMLNYVLCYVMFYFYNT